MRINWKKGFFSSKYKLLSGSKEIGEFHQPSFSNYSIGKLNNTKLKFKKKGFFKSETDILDLNLNQTVGHIKFDGWGSKASIRLHGKNYKWKYENFWHSKWSISENEKALINYKSSTTSGEIESSIDNESLILCGFFIFNYYLVLMMIISVSTAVIVSSG